ncbi:MAG: type II toxin-antitoxin system Phd/YefM family antitoxin [Propionibacteriaceae bacterium]|jgi:prevent-host-death family protein|nr:type II toxin-antitoxin system Phd/YefM family antitoxin [Propionibacteriaceae bacterium]
MTQTVTAADARAQFSRIAEEVSRTGSPVTVFKNSRPWVEIQPIRPREDTPSESTRQALREVAELKKTGARFTGYTDLIAALDATDAES